MYAYVAGMRSHILASNMRTYRKHVHIYACTQVARGKINKTWGRWHDSYLWRYTKVNIRKSKSNELRRNEKHARQNGKDTYSVGRALVAWLTWETLCTIRRTVCPWQALCMWYVCMHACMYVSMFVYMCVCVHIYMYMWHVYEHKFLMSCDTT